MIEEDSFFDIGFLLGHSSIQDPLHSTDSTEDEDSEMPNFRNTESSGSEESSESVNEETKDEIPTELSEELPKKNTETSIETTNDSSKDKDKDHSTGKDEESGKEEENENIEKSSENNVETSTKDKENQEEKSTSEKQATKNEEKSKEISENKDEKSENKEEKSENKEASGKDSEVSNENGETKEKSTEIESKEKEKVEKVPVKNNKEVESEKEKDEATESEESKEKTKDSFKLRFGKKKPRKGPDSARLAKGRDSAPEIRESGTIRRLKGARLPRSPITSRKKKTSAPEFGTIKKGRSLSAFTRKKTGNQLKEPSMVSFIFLFVFNNCLSYFLLQEAPIICGQVSTSRSGPRDKWAVLNKEQLEIYKDAKVNQFF